MRKTPTIPAAAARLKHRRLQREQRRRQLVALEALSEETNADIERWLLPSPPIVPAPSRREQSSLVWGFVWALLFAVVAAQAAAHGSIGWTHGGALLFTLAACIHSFSTWGRLRDARECPQHTEA